ncbi:uncharacterized protein CLUP02_06412 [Colletotrichum lupini]|uniref:Uncharacterized protein n=1 Tax=Colletotrichum lupini TaxID=145971 RepID=A0A9Q8SP55_9PEZI|nr:uncharacterized protein CLUP02_06412 [Colletotrichum lupini]UQC80926.1 hypothetical protein CLUP02_06412 [Colletotrichum lupini]
MIGQTGLCTPATIIVEFTALAALQQVTQEPALAQPPRVTFHGIHRVSRALPDERFNGVEARQRLKRSLMTSTFASGPSPRRQALSEAVISGQLPRTRTLVILPEAAKLSPSMRLRMIRDSSVRTDKIPGISLEKGGPIMEGQSQHNNPISSEIICESFINPLIGGMDNASPNLHETFRIVKSLDSLGPRLKMTDLFRQ